MHFCHIMLGVTIKKNGKRPLAPQPSELQALRRLYETFIPLQDEVWEAIQNVLIVHDVAKGDYWLEAGQVCNWVGFVAIGLVKQSFERNGEDVVGLFAHENCFTTEYVSFIKRQPSIMSIQALEDTRILSMSYDSMQKLYSTGAVAERIGRLVAESLYVEFVERAMSLQIDTPEVRYQRFSEQNPLLMQRVPLYMIASYLGITAESLSRIRARLLRKARA